MTNKNLWVIPNHKKCYTTAETETLYQQGQQIFGTQETVTDQQRIRGSLGEKLVAKLLQKYVNQNPFRWVCHSVQTHRKGEDGEIDHVLITPNYVFLIETKTIISFNKIHPPKPGATRFVGDKRNNSRVAREIPDSDLFKKVKYYHNRLGKPVKGILVLVNADTHIPNKCEIDDVACVPAHGLIRHITNTDIPEGDTIKDGKFEETVVFFAQNCLAH